MNTDKQFEWTDALVREAVESMTKQYTYGKWEGFEKEVESFKQSKVLPVGEPVPEKIKVEAFYIAQAPYTENCYLLRTNKMLSEMQFPEIKIKIESALNDTVVEYPGAFKKGWDKAKIESSLNSSGEQPSNDNAFVDEHYCEQEMHKCKINPYYFFTKHFTVNGQPATTAMSEKQFNDVFSHLHEPDNTVGKDYEILSYIYLDVVYTKQVDGSYRSFNLKDKLLDKYKTTIHSVKRLLDVEIFTVKDINVKYVHSVTPYEITHFTVKDGNIFINDHYAGSPNIRIKDWIKLPIKEQPPTDNQVTNNDDVSILSLNDLREIDHAGNGQILMITKSRLTEKLNQKIKQIQP